MWEGNDVKRILCCLLALALLGSAAALAEPFGEGKTLSVACLEGWYPAVTVNDNLEIWQEIEKQTGVHIEWEATADYDTAMQPRVASGQNLPDIMMISPSWSASGVYKTALSGLIIPLDDLITEHAPNIQKLLADYPGLKGLLTAPDGVMYTVADTPMFVNDLVVQNALFIREDWLKELGLEAPSTIEEWHDVLAAFKGKADTAFGGEAVPFSGVASTVGGFLSVFQGAYGLPVSGSNWWYDGEGKVFFVPASEQYKAWLTEMANWYAEGLVDIETRDEPNFQSLASTDVVGAFTTLSERVPMYDGLLKTAGVEGNHILLVPPMEEGKALLTKRPPTWGHYGITRDCADPELAIKWIDYVWGSDEGVAYTDWGIQGLTYDVDENGNKYYTTFVMNNPDGLDPYNALRSLGCSNTNLIRTPAEVYAALNLGSPAIPYGEALLGRRVEPFPDVMATSDEQAIIDRIQPDLNTFTSESGAKFLSGDKSLEEYDQFIETLYSIGLEELLAVKQAQFDRSGVMQ